MCAGIRNSLLALRPLLHSLSSLKGRHTGLVRAFLYVREGAYTIERHHFTRSIICERVFVSPVSGPSLGVFFSQRREVESCRSKCGKRRLYWRICATEASPCMGRKEQIRLSLDFETRARARAFSSLLQEILSFWWMHFSSRIVTYFTVPRVRSPMDKYIIMLEYSQACKYTVKSRDSHWSGAESQVLILRKQFQVCIFKQLFGSSVDNFGSPRSLFEKWQEEKLQKRDISRMR